MSEIKLYQEIKNALTDDERYQIIARAIELKSVDLSRIATKEDLSQLEIRILKTVGDNSNKVIMVIGGLITISKLLEHFKI